mmetsp:Transcript_15674/g.28048  ORF Transcript_15674/g.28048 Transcript_15674/m.28048 type:complete len:588 (-) Transcript_15674:346-2109(-)
MDLLQLQRSIILTVIGNSSGYKALILDKDTMKTCCTLFGRTELAQKEVVNIEVLGSAKETIHPELKGIVYMRPTADNIKALINEFKKPRYQSYYVYFTNILDSESLRILAAADAEKQLVQSLQECYCDVSVADSFHYLIPVVRPEILLQPRVQTQPDFAIVDRVVEGLSALSLSIRRRPLIRYQSTSPYAMRIAEGLYRLMYKQQYATFDFGAQRSPLLLILDRNDDPVTPLLSQWTYQAMIHELVGIQDNVVTMTHEKVPEDQREIVLDPLLDSFFREQCHRDFGEVGTAVRTLVEKFQSRSERHGKVETLEDMQRFVLEHHDFTKSQNQMSKHVNLMMQLSDIIKQRNLMEVSSIEQDLANPAANLSAAAAYDDLSNLIRDPRTQDPDRIRLAALFALRFEESDPIIAGQAMELLNNLGIKQRQPKLCAAVETLLQAAGSERRAGDLYGSRSLMNKAKNVFKGLKGVENVYTQHTPLLTETIAQAANDKLDPNAYPYMPAGNDAAVLWQSIVRQRVPQEVIVFIVGGTTYEEAKAVAEINERKALGVLGDRQVKVLLGGNMILNSSSFLKLLGAGSSPQVAVDIL